MVPAPISAKHPSLASGRDLLIDKGNRRNHRVYLDRKPFSQRPNTINYKVHSLDLFQTSWFIISLLYVLYELLRHAASNQV
jgi:hypothetical protein